MKRALVCWTTVKRFQPDYPMVDSMIAQAILAQEHPDLKEVLSVLKRAEAKTPDDADNFYLEGKTLVALGRYVDAANAFETRSVFARRSRTSIIHSGSHTRNWGARTWR